MWRQLVTLLLVHDVIEPLPFREPLDIDLTMPSMRPRSMSEASGDVRRDDDVVHLPQGVALRQRLGVP